MAASKRSQATAAFHTAKAFVEPARMHRRSGNRVRAHNCLESATYHRALGRAILGMGPFPK